MGDSYTKLFVHLVWSTWNRLPLLTETTETLAYRLMIAKATEMGCVVLAANGYTEHVHLLMRFPTTRSLAEIVRALKGVSSYSLEQIHQQPFQWQSGYSAFTLRESEVPIVLRYIHNQKEHHRSKTEIESWEAH